MDWSKYRCLVVVNTNDYFINLLLAGHWNINFYVCSGTKPFEVKILIIFSAQIKSTWIVKKEQSSTPFDCLNLVLRLNNSWYSRQINLVTQDFRTLPPKFQGIQSVVTILTVVIHLAVWIRIKVFKRKSAQQAKRSDFLNEI